MMEKAKLGHTTLVLVFVPARKMGRSETLPSVFGTALGDAVPGSTLYYNTQYVL